jgi:hypothetical protein
VYLIFLTFVHITFAHRHGCVLKIFEKKKKKRKGEKKFRVVAALWLFILKPRA